MRDTLPEDNIFYYIIVVASVISTVDITSEMLESGISIFARNDVKKLMLWTLIYTKTKSIIYTSAISILVFAFFPKVFFGQVTSPTLKKIKCQEKTDNPR